MYIILIVIVINLNILICIEIFWGCVDDFLYCDNGDRYIFVCKVLEVFYMVLFYNLIIRNWYLKYDVNKSGFIFKEYFVIGFDVLLWCIDFRINKKLY